MPGGGLDPTYNDETSQESDMSPEVRFNPPTGPCQDESPCSEGPTPQNRGYSSDEDSPTCERRHIKRPRTIDCSHMQDIPGLKNEELEFRVPIDDLEMPVTMGEKSINGFDFKITIGWRSQTDGDIDVIVEADPAKYGKGWEYSDIHLSVWCINQEDWHLSEYADSRCFFNSTHRMETNTLRLESEEPYLTSSRELVFRIGVYFRLVSSFPNGLSKDFVGIKNLGATCYLGSLVQSLYHIKFFRNAVLTHQEADDDDQPSWYGVPLDYITERHMSELQQWTKVQQLQAWQNMFYDLLGCRATVGPEELISSFGWVGPESQIQQDYHEFWRVIADTLENRMIDSSGVDIFEFLFEGKVESFVQCLDVPVRSCRTETFYDVQLDVHTGSVEQALENYMSVELLDGDNMYTSDDHGKQRANKGVRFLEFPPVATFLLKRFEMNMVGDDLVIQKDHSAFTFPDSLDLSPYCPNSGTYRLHAVVVHLGEVHGGHYYVYVRPNGGDTWLRFEDDKVTEVSMETAVTDNYGGEIQIPHNYLKDGRIRTRLKNHSAYVLYYIKESMLDQLMRCDIPHNRGLALTQRQSVREGARELHERYYDHLREKLVIRVTTEEALRSGPIDLWKRLSIPVSCEWIVDSSIADHDLYIDVHLRARQGMISGLPRLKDNETVIIYVLSTDQNGFSEWCPLHTSRGDIVSISSHRDQKYEAHLFVHIVSMPPRIELESPTSLFVRKDNVPLCRSIEHSSRLPAYAAAYKALQIDTLKCMIKFYDNYIPHTHQQWIVHATIETIAGRETYGQLLHAALPSLQKLFSSLHPSIDFKINSTQDLSMALEERGTTVCLREADIIPPFKSRDSIRTIIVYLRHAPLHAEGLHAYMSLLKYPVTHYPNTGPSTPELLRGNPSSPPPFVGPRPPVAYPVARELKEWRITRGDVAEIPVYVLELYQSLGTMRASWDSEARVTRELKMVIKVEYTVKLVLTLIGSYINVRPDHLVLYFQDPHLPQASAINYFNDTTIGSLMKSQVPHGIWVVPQSRPPPVRYILYRDVNTKILCALAVSGARPDISVGAAVAEYVSMIPEAAANTEHQMVMYTPLHLSVLSEESSWSDRWSEFCKDDRSPLICGCMIEPAPTKGSCTAVYWRSNTYVGVPFNIDITACKTGGEILEILKARIGDLSKWEIKACNDNRLSQLYTIVKGMRISTRPKVLMICLTPQAQHTHYVRINSL